MAPALRVTRETLTTVLLLTFSMRVAQQQQVGGCGDVLTQPSGSITSPLYPRNYSDNLDCTYIIRASAGRRITLTFLTFQTEPGSIGCNHDFIQIRDGDSVTSPSLGVYCNTTVPAKVRSASNSMWIRFHSDSSVSAAGFEATYYTAIVPQKFLLLTNTFLKVIHRMDLETGSNFVIPIEGLKNPIAVDYDPVEARLYWTDVVEKTVRSAGLDGSNTRLVRNLGPEAVPDGLAVDSVSRLIFYTDAGNDVIVMIAMNSFRHKIVVGSGLDQPRAIELDRRNGVIYWSDWGATPKIERVNYDGTERKTIVSGHQYLHWPNGLALDTVGKRLYWVDGFVDKLSWTDLEGTAVSVIITLPGTHFFGLDLYLNDLFVTDWGLQSLLQVPTSFIHQISPDGKARKTIGSVQGRLNDIHLYSEETDETAHMTSGCRNNNGGCRYLCVPVRGNSTKCLDPEGVTSQVPTSGTTADITSVTAGITSVTAGIPSVTPGIPSDTAGITSVTAGIPSFTPDTIRSTSSASTVVTDIRELTDGIKEAHGTNFPGISLQLVIIIVGCVIVSITIASCAIIVIIVYRKSSGKRRDTSLRFLRQRCDDLSHTRTPYADVKAGYTNSNPIFDRELSSRSENVYDEPLSLIDLSPAEDDEGYLHPVKVEHLGVAK